ncbi:MAG: hypothetical protein IT452_02175 [Planctomycetia bacterium]|nr:hypothetical protein [Planctomycetia bacterium]
MTSTEPCLGACTVVLACLALAGCSSGPAPASGDRPPARPVVRIEAERGGAEVPLSEADLRRWSSRFALQGSKNREACERELVRESPDLALESFRRLVGNADAGPTAFRGRIAAAWEAAFAEPALGESEAARLAHPAETGRAIDALLAGLEPRDQAAKLAEAAGIFRSIGDAFWAEECGRLAAARGVLPDEPPSMRPAPPTAAQAGLRDLEAARAHAIARRWAQAREGLPRQMESALRRRDLSLATDLEDLRGQPEIAAAFAPHETRRWLVGLGELALSRGLHLLALRCAMTARDAVSPGVDAAGRDAARRLFARAAAARGDLPLALRGAEELLEDARSSGDREAEAVAAGLCADILLAEDRAKEAAGLYLHAATVADARSADAARLRLGGAAAFLSAGMLAPCARTLAELSDSASGSTGPVGRKARFTSALLAAARDDNDEAGRLLARVLADAEAAGDVTLAEQCDALSERLR